MRKFPRFISTQVSSFFSAETLVKIQTPVFMPFYHVVSDEALPHVLNYNFRNLQQFEKELDFYLKHFQPVTLEDLIANPFPRKKVFHLSFDDGLKQCAEIIAPVLLKKGIPASFFVNTGFVDNRSLFHKYKASLLLQHLKDEPHQEALKQLKTNNLDGHKILQATIHQDSILDEIAETIGLDFKLFLQKQKPYLSTSQIFQLQNQGFVVGAHSVSHPEFWLLSEEEQWNEIQQSMTWLEKNIKPKIKTYAFPFSDFGVSKSLLKKMHQEQLCDISFGTAGIKFDEVENHFQRYPVEQNGEFINNLKSELVYFVIRSIIGKATVKH